MNQEAWRIYNNDSSIHQRVRYILTKAREDIAHEARLLETGWHVDGYDLESTLDLLKDMTPAADCDAAISRAAAAKAAELALDEDAGRPWEAAPVLIGHGMFRTFREAAE